jgi:hypothetical protein
MGQTATETFQVISDGMHVYARIIRAGDCYAAVLAPIGAADVLRRDGVIECKQDHGRSLHVFLQESAELDPMPGALCACEKLTFSEWKGVSGRDAFPSAWRPHQSLDINIG